jgi:glycosyltransferase involved in cell wall biosynthesis
MVRHADLVERLFEGHDGIQVERHRLLESGLGLRSRWGAAARARALCADERFDVVHLLDGSHAYLLAGAYARRTLVTVHDLIPALQARRAFPVARPGRSARALIELNLWALARAGALCADSRCTAHDVQRLVGRDVDAVLPLVVESPRREATARSTSGHDRGATVLHVGNNGFYKNRAGAIRIFGRMQRQRPELSMITIGPPADAAITEALATVPAPGRVAFLENPDDEVLEACYEKAGVLLFPSLYEGFGWPPLEAMRAGCLVVASDRGSLPEVMEAAGKMHDPEDEAGFAGVALEVLRTVRDAACERTVLEAHVRRFAPEHMRAGLVRLYEGIGTT